MARALNDKEHQVRGDNNTYKQDHYSFNTANIVVGRSFLLLCHIKYNIRLESTRRLEDSFEPEQVFHMSTTEFCKTKTCIWFPHSKNENKKLTTYLMMRLLHTGSTECTWSSIGYRRWRWLRGCNRGVMAFVVAPTCRRRMYRLWVMVMMTRCVWIVMNWWWWWNDDWMLWYLMWIWRWTRFNANV